MTAGVTDEKLADALLDPVAFAQGYLGHKVWQTQAEILRSVRDNPRTAVKAAHGCSKTFAGAEAVLWWIARYRDGIALTTSPTGRQVEALLWGEIRKTLQEKPIPAYPPSNLACLKLREGNYAMGFSTSPENSGVNIQGFHGAHLLIVIDEAPGIEGPIWEAIEGARAGGVVHQLLLGNPTIIGGPYYDAFTKDRSLWHQITIDAFDTPNLEGFTLDTLRQLPPGLKENDHKLFAYKPWPPLVSRFWVYEQYWKYGEESPFWQARVRGQFPTQSDDALYPLLWLERARGIRDLPSIGSGYRGPVQELIVGIDVACSDGGDETAVTVRAGNQILIQQAWSKFDPRGEVAAFLAPFKDRIRIVNVDANTVGHYFALHLVDLGYRVDFIGFGDAPTNKDRPSEAQFANRKAEMYWRTRELLERGGIEGLDDTTISQAASVRYSHDSHGRLTIESKAAARKRGIRSPDRWESVILAFGVIPPEFGWTSVKELTRQRASSDDPFKRRPSDMDNPLHNKGYRGSRRFPTGTW